MPAHFAGMFSWTLSLRSNDGRSCVLIYFSSFPLLFCYPHISITDCHRRHTTPSLAPGFQAEAKRGRFSGVLHHWWDSGKCEEQHVLVSTPLTKQAKHVNRSEKRHWRSIGPFFWRGRDCISRMSIPFSTTLTANGIHVGALSRSHFISACFCVILSHCVLKRHISCFLSVSTPSTIITSMAFCVELGALSLFRMNVDCIYFVWMWIVSISRHVFVKITNEHFFAFCSLFRVLSSLSLSLSFFVFGCLSYGLSFESAVIVIASIFAGHDFERAMRSVHLRALFLFTLSVLSLPSSHYCPSMSSRILSALFILLPLSQFCHSLIAYAHPHAYSNARVFYLHLHIFASSKTPFCVCCPPDVFLLTHTSGFTKKWPWASKSFCLATHPQHPLIWRMCNACAEPWIVSESGSDQSRGLVQNWPSLGATSL